MLLSSWTTERLGVHALFGAFIEVSLCPKKSDSWRRRLERLRLTLAILLPLFFALTGLWTRIDLLTGVHAWGYAIAIIGVAIVGKVAGATFPARFTE